MNKILYCFSCKHDLADVTAFAPKANDPTINPDLSQELNGNVYSCRYKDNVIWTCGCVHHNIEFNKKTEMKA